MKGSIAMPAGENGICKYPTCPSCSNCQETCSLPIKYSPLPLGMIKKSILMFLELNWMKVLMGIR